MIEEKAFDAWPAAEAQTLGEWRLRANHGVTNRANSVWAVGDPGVAKDAAIDAVEAFYRERSQPPIFQLSPLTRPRELEAALAERGYESSAPVTVQVAKSKEAAGGPTSEEVVLEAHGQLREDWFELSGSQGRYVGEATLVYRRMMERVAPHACFALARRAGRPVAVGLGVEGGGWVGVFSMLTLAEHRGIGIGREILRGIARWAVGRGTHHLYLQVEADNTAAQALYASAGFETLYGYHYRRGLTGNAT
jgi:GNAT superfamily N-acetyltransferase